MLSTVLSFLIVGIIAIVVIGVVLAVVGAVLGLAFTLVGFLLFKVAPLLLVGYVVFRLFSRRKPRLSKADREWLES